MRSDRDHPTLRELIRSGDPADDGSEPTREELAQLRRVVLRGALTGQARWRWLPLAALAAGLLAAALLWMPEEPTPPVRVEAPASEERRQIQFATEEGTRIIWVLDPNLEL